MSKNHPRTLAASTQPPSTLSFPQGTKRARRDNDKTLFSDKSLFKISKRQRACPEDQQRSDFDHDVKVTIGRMDTHLLADYVTQHTKRYQTELSAAELEDLRIPGKYTRLLNF